jgi:hypothetical protein
MRTTSRDSKAYRQLKARIRRRTLRQLIAGWLRALGYFPRLTLAQRKREAWGAK